MKFYSLSEHDERNTIKRTVSVPEGSNTVPIGESVRKGYVAGVKSDIIAVWDIQKERNATRRHFCRIA